MKSIIKSLVAVIFCSLIMACDNEVFEHINRTINDPIDSELNVSMYRYNDRITISWAYDINCDYYMLYRRDDRSGFSRIYTGTDLSFVDYKVDDDTKYYYRLDKVRGEATFRGTKIGHGIKSSYYEHGWELKNGINNPEKLNFYQTEATSYRVVFDDEKVIFDSDYYVVEVLPNTTVDIKVEDLDLPNNSSYLGVYYTCEENSIYENHIAQKTKFSLKNNTNDTKNIIVKLYMNDTDTTRFGTTSKKIIRYTIRIDNISVNGAGNI